jgi:hypothetical protein
MTPNSHLPVSALMADIPATVYRVRAARDPVLVVAFTGGGLISYLREDGTLMHRLNTSEGFYRKLRQLGIEMATVTTGPASLVESCAQRGAGE